MVEIINSFIELFTIIMVYNILFEKKSVKDIALSVAISFIGIITYKVPVLSVILPLIEFSFLVKFRDNQTIRNSFIKMSVSLVIFIIMEAVVGIIVGLFTKEAAEKYLTYILIVVFTLCLFVIDHLKIKIREQLFEFIRVNIRILLLFITNILIILLIIKFINNNININTSNIQLTILFALMLGFILISILICKEIMSEISKKKDLENKLKYNSILDDCFQQLKQHEHEYKNHLNAIYSMLQIDGDDAHEKVKNYIEENRNLDNLNGFLYIDNLILKAVIFSKLTEAQKLGVKFEYNIKSNLKNININENELTILVTNLLTNAIEASEESESPYVCITTDEIAEPGKIKSIIEVKNTAIGLDKIDISEIFKTGASSKSKDRGYGLANVKKIVDRNKGDILVEISNETISIKVVLT